MSRAYTDAQMLLATQIAYLNCGEYEGYTIREILNILENKYSGHGELDKFGNKELDVLKTIRDMIAENGLESALDWTIRDVGDRNGESGMYACLIDTNDGNAIVGFRGSESYNSEQFTKDWVIADFTLLHKNGTTKQENDAQAYMEYVAEKYGADYERIGTTGHSLGGHLAEHVTINAPASIQDKIECTNFDGPGFSDEYQRNHAEQIKENGGKIIHYQWSLVGGLLNPTPGSKFQTIKASDPEGMGDPFLRHHTNNVVLDENGNIIPADIEPVSLFTSVGSKIIENWNWTPFIPFDTWVSVPIMTVFVMVSATLTYVVAKEVVDFFQQKFDDFRRSLRDTFGHSVRGEFEVNTGALRSNPGNYGQAGKELHRIAEEVSRIEKSLQYDSLSGGLTKAALWRISGCIDKDGKHAEKLEDALYKVHELYFNTERLTVDRFDGL